MSVTQPSVESPTPLRRAWPLSLVIAMVAAVLWLALRIVLWLDLGNAKPGWSDALHALALGSWFDAWTLAYLMAPLILFSGLLPSRLRTSRVVSFLRWGFLWAAMALLIFGVVAEFIFWQEFTTRFNFIAVDYLVYTHEVLGNIWESYPVPLILAVIGLVATFAVWGVSRVLTIKAQPHSWRKRLVLIGVGIVLPLAATQFANLDQSESSNHYTEELAGNGLFTFAAAMRRNELDYDKFYATLPEQQVAQVLGRLGVHSGAVADAQQGGQSGVMQLDGLPANFKRRPKNIVLVTVESLSADYLGSFGGRPGLTPALDKLASEGLKFSNLYATGTRTVRGLEALSLGTPPIPGQAIIHRPNNEHLATLGEQLKNHDYRSFFIYGGYGVFDNMNYYFRNNDYQVIDRTDFPANTIAAENVWGVADESLFANTLVALDKADAEGRPFMAQIMTTSNHRPYTFPAGRVNAAQGSRSGAVAYTDYAIGHFIEQARSKRWFKDTLFVIVADHCASVAGKTSLPVAKYHIPLIFYAPDLLVPGTYDRLASQMDIAPTLMQVLGVSPSQRFYGESLFAAQLGEPRAFISNYQDLGYYKRGQLIVLSPKGKVQAFHIDPKDFEATPVAVDETLKEEAIAYYQSASHAFQQGKLKYASPAFSSNRSAL